MFGKQQLSDLRQGVREFLEATCHRDYLRRRLEGGAPSLLPHFEQLGVFRLFDEIEGSGIPEIVMLAEECGYALVPERLPAYLTWGPLLVRSLGEAAYSGDASQQILKGTLRLTRAPQGGVTLGAGGGSSAGGGLCGRITSALLGREVTHLLVAEDTGTLHAIDLSAEGVVVAYHNGFDLLLPVATVTLSDVSPSFSVSLPDLLGVRFNLLVALLIQAECLGACRRALDMTSEYCGTREQFGVPIGGFQAIQQGLADHYAATEAMRSLVHLAAMTLEEDPLRARGMVLSGLAKAHRSCRETIEACIQYHGGIGFTWEYDLHLLLRRVMVLLSELPWNQSRALELLSVVMHDGGPLVRESSNTRS